jgi:hypothetical protein
MPRNAKPLERDALIAQIRETAARLGVRRLTRSQFIRETGVPVRQILRHGGFSKCAQAAGLSAFSGVPPLTDDALLEALREAFIRLEGAVSLRLFQETGRYHLSTYRKHFGSWKGALAALATRLEQREPDFSYLPAVHALIRETPGPRLVAPGATAPDERAYGQPLHFHALQHAPVNENGVLFLFGALAGDLGFVVETIASAFPDCTAKRRPRGAGDLWSRVRIEFEHQSRNFKAHGHDPQGCDLIVCWEHNWPECPLEVIELKKVVASASAPLVPV